MEENLQQQMTTINTLADHEAVIGALYKKYAEKFENSDFWNELFRQERIHYQWLHTLSDTSNGKIYFDDNRFPIVAITGSIDHIKKLIEDSPQHTLVNALSFALDIEQGLIERKYFEVFQTDAPEVKHILTDLQKATEEHVMKVKSEMVNRNMMPISPTTG